MEAAERIFKGVLCISVLFLQLMGSNLQAGAPLTKDPAGRKPHRPVHTYSIVARDSVTGELGVAVQSHWYSVGSVVAWAEAHVGHQSAG